MRQRIALAAHVAASQPGPWYDKPALPVPVSGMQAFAEAPVHLDQWLSVFVAGALSGSIVVYADPFATSAKPGSGLGEEAPLAADEASSGILGTPDSPTDDVGSDGTSAPADPAEPAEPTSAEQGAEGGAGTAYERPSRGGSRSGTGHAAVTAPRLTKHLAAAPGMWRELAETARESGNPLQTQLANDIAMQAEFIPSGTDRLPPLSEMAAYLASSQALLVRMKSAGMDCGELDLQITELSKPRGAR